MELKRTVSNDGTKIAYEVTGSGPVLLMVNGAMGHRNFRGEKDIAELLAPNFTVVCYDRRGRGESTDTLPYAVDREIEDIEAIINQFSGTVYMYGFSSGAVLALRAVSRLGNKLSKLILHEPPFGGSDDASKREFSAFCSQLNGLVESNDMDGAVACFLADMVPPDILEQIKQSPDWNNMTSVAFTLSYDNAVMGDGAVPEEVAKSIPVQTLLLTGEDSPEFKHKASVTLSALIPDVVVKKISGQHTIVEPEILAKIITDFLIIT